MDPEYLELPNIDDEEIPSDPMEDALKSLAQTQAQLGASLQQIAHMQDQLGQAIMHALQQIAQTNKQLSASIAALAAPRRRIAVRDGEGRITHADDIPMSFQ